MLVFNYYKNLKERKQLGVKAAEAFEKFKQFDE